MDPNAEFQRLQMQREEQEQNLNMIINQTGEIKQITIMIGNELHEHNKLLSDVSEKMETIQGKMERNIQNMEKLTQSKNSPLCIISIVLTLVLIFLLYLVL